MGSRSMDKLDFCLIPFIYLLRLIVTILFVSTLFVHTPSKIERTLKNSLTWADMCILRLIIFSL